jgi:heme/copper-type cytochrome/quinol oxidase subunit 2
MDAPKSVMVMKKSVAILVTLVLYALFGLHLWSLLSYEPSQKSFSLSAQKFSFTPNILEVTKGDKVVITLSSEDVEHGFYLDGYELEMHAKPGVYPSVSFTADKVGKFSYRCSITCGSFHPYMIGWLKVNPNFKLIISLWLTVTLGWLTILYALHRGKMLE